MGSVLLHQYDDGVRELVLNRPEKRNAMSREMNRELTEHLVHIAADAGARSLVLSATGPAFCAGADLSSVFDSEVEGIDGLRARLSEFYESILSLHALAVPTVAAINGPAIGAGLNLALACDVRVGSMSAVLGATFTNIGLHPGGGCTYFLVQILGLQRALRALWEGRTFDATRALEHDLIDEIVDDPRARALEIARRYASVDPVLIRDVKQTARIAAGHGLEASLHHELWAQARSAAGQVFQDHLNRFKGGRA